jgi:PhzF family phenazine biosynthesis protein
MNIRLLVYSAFTASFEGGNPAGIFWQDADLNSGQMQDIARLAGYSETVFIHPSHKANYRFRYFTPDMEVPACGHATLAALTWLKDSGELKSSKGSVETPGGLLPFMMDSNTGFLFIRQPAPVYGPVLDPEPIAGSLGISSDSLAPGLPVQCMSTGLWDIMVPVKDETILMKLKPDMAKIQKISHEASATGYHVFSPANHQYAAYCRNFAPAAGIPEESATGTASGALGAYLIKHGSINSSHMIFRQGDALNRPSEIHVYTENHNSSHINIRVGGQAIFLGKKILTI